MLPREIWEKIKAVFFDAEGTLLHIKPSVGHIYVKVCQKYGLQADPKALGESFQRAFAAHLKRRKQGEITLSPDGCREEWRRVFQEAVSPFGELGSPEKAFEECYEAFARAEAFSLAPGTREALTAIKISGRRLAIVSNWDERLRRLLEEYGLCPLFEKIFISCEVGVAKPDPQIFLIACQHLGIEPQEALMIGDSLEDDVLAARQAGLWALHYTGGDLRRLFPL